MESVRKKLHPQRKQLNFEIFGFDYILDADFNTWLIEANTNPCLEESSPLLEALLPRMLDDAFKLTLDVVFPTEREKRAPSKFPVQGYLDWENMW